MNVGDLIIQLMGMDRNMTVVMLSENRERYHAIESGDVKVRAAVAPEHGIAFKKANFSQCFDGTAQLILLID